MRELFSRGLRGEAQKETRLAPSLRGWTVGHLARTRAIQQGFDIAKSTQAEGGTILLFRPEASKAFTT